MDLYLWNPAFFGKILFENLYFWRHKKAAIKLRLFNLVARPGFEPRQTAPKTVVLPLYYQAIRSFISEWAAKIGRNLKFSK
jgi:hypothetical protein